MEWSRPFLQPHRRSSQEPSQLVLFLRCFTLSFPSITTLVARTWTKVPSNLTRFKFFSHAFHGEHLYSALQGHFIKVCDSIMSIDGSERFKTSGDAMKLNIQIIKDTLFLSAGLKKNDWTRSWAALWHQLSYSVVQTERTVASCQIQHKHVKKQQRKHLSRWAWALM